MIRLGHVSVTPKARELVNMVLNSGEIGQSEIIHEFERKFAKWLGVRYCVAVCNGTMADTIALAVLKYLNPDKDEVIVPALTFIAQVNAVYYNRLKPVFFDEGMPVGFTDKTLCVFPVHLLGKPSALTPMPAVVVEDACEAMGSERHGQKCGSIGAIGTFSFFPSHTISTGEGGMIATNNEEYAVLAKRFINHGKTGKDEFHFDCIGFNGKMSSVTAALGLGMLPELNHVIEARRDRYFRLGGTEDAILEKICPHAFPVILNSRTERDAMLEKLRAAGVECRNLFSSIPTQEKAYEFLGHKLGHFPEAEKIGDCGLYVPCHSGLSDQDIETIKGVLFSETSHRDKRPLASGF